MEWPLHDAKNRLSAVIEAARRGQPQTVTKRGVATAVILSVDEYRRLCDIDAATTPNFCEHLLAIPRDDSRMGREHESAGDERLDVALRDPEF